MTPRLRIDKDTCQEIARASRLEWLETNGLGGFASASITGMNTRRYHGLLMAAVKPPAGRMLLLAKLDETLVAGGERVELGVNQFPGALHPAGHGWLEEFRLDPFPVFRYRFGGVTLEKRLFLVHGENTLAVEYALVEDSAACELEVRPFLAFRDFHSLARANPGWNAALHREPECVTLKPFEGLPPLRFLNNAHQITPAGDWWRSFEYERERERGLDFQEDLFQPFVAKFTLTANEPARLLATIEDARVDLAAFPGLRDAEIQRRKQLSDSAGSALVASLKQAADQFIVRRGDGHTVIAGYHWFGDWGRDTMIALPGLTLSTGRFDIARGILRTFAEHVDQGMLPNRFPDAGEAPEYNTVDAALWFFEAARTYLEASADAVFVREALYPKLKEIVEWHVTGTRYGIHVDQDGLLACGAPGAQLTWMDAKVGDWVVTPRHGKPVEIQALWYNALRVMGRFAAEFAPQDKACFNSLAKQAKASFNAAFWNEAAGCLFDVINGEQRDAAIRPNQIFAVSLPHSMLPAAKARDVVQTVERELLTPAGLRTLAASHPDYRPRYEGSVYERDSAYHQGTVWPWLMGPFLTAYLRVNRTKAAREQVNFWLGGFEAQMTTAGLGQLAEIADAEAPHSPRGCIAQAWSVAEILRVAISLQQHGV